MTLDQRDVRWRGAAHIDLSRIVHLDQQCFTTPWPMSAFARELRIPFARLRLVERPSDDQLLGFIDYWVVGEELHLLVLAVDPGHRRRGLANALVRGAEQDAALRGATYSVLEVRQGNEAARLLYEQLGYAHVGVKRGYYSDSGEDALMWMKFL